MRERGQANPVYWIVGAVIALTLFVVIVVFLTQGSGNDVFRFLGTLLPSFNRTQEKVAGEEKVRYVISSDALEYYDGTSWKAFGEGERTLGKKRITGSGLGERFRIWYYQRREAEAVELDGIWYARISDVLDRDYESARAFWEWKGLQRIFGSEATRTLKRGDVLIELWKRGQATKAGQLEALYVLPAGEARVVSVVKELKEDVLGKNYAWEKEVLLAALQWRESALEKPLTLVYQDSEGKEHDSAACVKRTPGTQELVAEISKSVQAGERCR